MFWDHVACVYDVFVNVINIKTHRRLKEIVAGQICHGDRVLECACGTGMLSGVIAKKCKALTATDFSPKMLAKAKKNCAAFANITFAEADITALPYENGSFDKVVAGNVLHLLPDPLAALEELDRVVKPGGTLILPTYINRTKKGGESAFSAAVGKAGADFKQAFTVETYSRFFRDAGYRDAAVTLADGRVPCAVAVMKKKTAPPPKEPPRR